MSRENTIKTLMNRDGITRQEADELITETLEVMQEYIDAGHFIEAENVFMQNLGLEMDYYLDIAM